MQTPTTTDSWEDYVRDNRINIRQEQL